MKNSIWNIFAITLMAGQLVCAYTHTRTRIYTHTQPLWVILTHATHTLIQSTSHQDTAGDKVTFAFSRFSQLPVSHTSQQEAKSTLPSSKTGGRSPPELLDKAEAELLLLSFGWKLSAQPQSGFSEKALIFLLSTIVVISYFFLSQ